MKPEPDDLPAVVKEIFAALLDGDWTRYSDKSGEHFYYIIREHDHAREVLDRHDFSSMLTFADYRPDLFEDWYIRSALAEEPPDRLARARKRVAAAGVAPAFFDAVIDAVKAADSVAELRAVLDAWMPKFINERGIDALAAVLEAVRIERTRQRHIFVSETDRPALRGALQAVFLKELGERFPKVINRAVGFDWLSFSDPQLREACRCYLYGFVRAGVVLAVAALETRLKQVAVVDELPKYGVLVDLVFGPAGAYGEDRARAAALKDVFRLRNRIVHGGTEPSGDEAARTLDVVRETLETLTQRFDQAT